ncbi:hypothetical protein [Thetidibacter halocola]|uniref:DUF2125 domain-containing protein n=1 Tax=Thetidibacter halocola TaxID=2827239 RepID=A0A8J7WEP8_9RHOB|nr:hypothetical protein [Thetidibacter halocola]MBS0126250.1 hypothetical protein [Thetidibacter halocola]
MKRLTGATALALCAVAAPALAEVTPKQVWDDLEAYLEGFGYVVEATESTFGDKLTVTGITIAMTMPETEEGGGDVTISMDEVTLTGRSDGSVTVTFPEQMPVAVDVTSEGEQVEMVIDYTHDALELIVSGDPDAMTYDYAATSLAMVLGSLFVDGEEVTRDMARFEVAMGPLDGTSTVTRDGDTRSIAQDFTMGDIRYTAVANDPESGEGGTFAGSLRGVSMIGSTTLPEAVDMTDMQAAVAAGFAGSGTIGHQGGEMQFSVTEKAGTTSGQTSASSGYISVGFTQDALTYALGGKGTSLSVTGPELPLPISAEMAETKLAISLPLQPSGTPQPAALGLTLGGFAMSEMLWNVFDPGAILPRDPATVSLDLVAQVTPFVSLLDAQAMASLGDAPPGELNALTLTGLVVEGAGGRITGSGDLTFDNTDLESFDGMPRPEGTISLSVSGANGLIDKLIQMGILAEDDAMGARMMLSMFTVPSGTPDQMTSTIEFNDQGHVLANGQRIK